jgi:acyl-coenzyme A thioesterase PaaI-like protein
VYGVATPLARSRSLTTYQIIISDEEDNRICTARLTCMLKPYLKD